MGIYFTADHHFGHENIIKYCHRPYNDVEEMNEDLVEKHNDIVDENDHVYHLGDVAFSNNPRTWLEKLNGRFTLIKGNHDRNDNEYWEEVCEKFIQHQTTLKISDLEYGLDLVHNPKLPAPERIGEIVICGHVHAEWRFRPNYLNVGVDAWHFRPVSKSTVLEYVKKNLKRREYNKNNRGYHDPHSEIKLIKKDEIQNRVEYDD